MNDILNDIFMNIEVFMDTELGPIFTLILIYAIFIHWLPNVVGRLMINVYDDLPNTVKVLLNAVLPPLEDRVALFKSRVDMYFVAKVRATDNQLDDSLYAIISAELADKIDLIDVTDNAEGLG